MDILQKIIVSFWVTIAEMSPYLLFGFFAAGLLSVFISPRLVERHLGGRGILPVLKASLFGIPLPLCSCGVIPVSMSLDKHGASKGSTISFLLSTPQTGVDSLFVTYSLLGPVFAVIRPVAALITGLVGGSLVDLFGHKGASSAAHETCTDSCCAAAASGFARRLLHGLRYGFVVLPHDIGKAMLVGLAIGALIAALVPEGFFAEKLGTGIGAMLLMMVLGIPIYVCATASVPIAAAMILKGLTPGAALVFLMTGPATNAAGLATIWHTLGRRTAILYLLTVAGCAVTFGSLIDAVALRVNVTEAVHRHPTALSPIDHLWAIALLLLLAYPILKPLWPHKPAAPQPQPEH
jgi:uncharacterized membrane protein YraQ (UPF0718 family)